MTEEVKTENVDTTQQEREFTPVELKALEQGWIPKEEFTGDESDFIDAPEFVRRGELFSKIDHQSRELKNVKKALEALQDHHSKVADASYKKALNELKAQKRAARADGDLERYDEISEQIEQVEEEARSIQEERENIQIETPQIHPELQAWINRNPWYSTQPHMKLFADRLGPELKAQGLMPAAILKRIEDEVRKEFPTKFRNPNKDKPSAVEGGNATSGKGNKEGLSSFEASLSSEERAVMHRLTSGSAPAMTKEQYLKEYKLVKERQ